MDLTRARRIAAGLARRATRGLSPEAVDAMAKLAVRCDAAGAEALAGGDVTIDAFRAVDGRTYCGFTARTPDGETAPLDAGPECVAIIDAILKRCGRSQGIGTNGDVSGLNVVASVVTEVQAEASATMRAAALAGAWRMRSERALALAEALEANGMPLAARRARRICLESREDQDGP